MPRILVVDDEKPVLEMIRRALDRDTIEVRTEHSPYRAIEIIPEFMPDVVITDVRMEGMDGFSVLKEVKRLRPETNVIIITAFASVDTAVQALREGAFDYLIKPFKIADLRTTVTRALSEKKIVGVPKKKSMQTRDLVGTSSGMKAVKEMIKRVAKADSTVLIYGESGTGKELVARALHTCSLRGTKAFISINCAALPDTLLESELFGYEKGSFTGALDTRIGLIESAHGGSLFLDEIGDISPALQAKLLRVLQEKELRRVGGVQDIPVDVRVIVATSKDLEGEVKRGTFREDLLYRLNVIAIHIPPVRERKEDIRLLVTHFLSLYNEKNNRHITCSEDALRLLESYEWPGNVRELEHTIERIATLSDETTITKEILESKWGKTIVSEPRSDASLLSVLKKDSESQEREVIMHALRETGGNKQQAAKLLHISKQSLQYKLKKYGLQ